MREKETREATATRTVLPAGKTAATEESKRGRRAGQADKLFEGRLLQLSKAYAPFLETGAF
ncbi:hypothetical protein C0Z20_00280 [Trinickia symbiotica]|uniref:Uncharacterized protein n=1 Tax=Trinickia symbiotica TaxID=863227 RepID=A0A2N7X9T4_9BURK|nr:hypothetical protein C0Z20_00280 [Trinickia symbiotica]